MSASTWSDVEYLVARLPDPTLEQAHRGSPASYAGRQPFARLRWDEQDRQIIPGCLLPVVTHRVVGPQVAVTRSLTGHLANLGVRHNVYA
ncbi:MAG: hypothetical protein ACRDP4_09420, partial [Nocardioidaceae bacterium]